MEPTELILLYDYYGELLTPGSGSALSCGIIRTFPLGRSPRN